MSYRLRPFQPADEPALAAIMAESLEALGCHRSGCLSGDDEPAQLFDRFDVPGSDYLVVVDDDDTVLGGGGYALLEGGPEATAEIQKMYLAQLVRGIGVGRALLEALVAGAAAAGYERLYLETMPEMEDAQRLYWANGFIPREGRLGDTGHASCTVFMERVLRPV